MCAGTGTVINKSGIKQYQQATRDRSKVAFHKAEISCISASWQRLGPCLAMWQCLLKSDHGDWHCLLMWPQLEGMAGAAPWLSQHDATYFAQC